MLFFPYKADIDVRGIPLTTVAVVLLCFGVFFLQIQSERDYEHGLTRVCTKIDNRVLWSALARMNERNDASLGCVEFLRRTDRYNTAREPVEKLVGEMSGGAGAIQGRREYLTAELGTLQQRFNSIQPAGLLIDRLAYDPKSWDPVRMITAALAHGGWMHLLGNLVFLWAFAVTAEAILGSWRFALFCLAMALGTHAVYSLASVAGNALPTVGLSGVVYAVMALTAYFLPGIRIRTALWVIIKFYTLLIPAWFFVLWYAGLDTYQLFSGEDSGGVNLVAHVSGAALALGSGVLLFRGRRRVLHEALSGRRRPAARKNLAR